MLEYGEPDPRDDVYGLSVVAYELLTGKHPFNRKPATYARDLELKPARPKELPKEIWQALSHGLEFDREKRTQNATQFLKEMSGPRPGRDNVLPKWVVPAAISIALLLVIAIGSLIFVGQNGGGQTEIPLKELEETSTLEPAMREKVESILEVAEVHLLVGRLLEPPGSSAYDAYKQVQTMHTKNKQAVEGLRKIGDLLVEEINGLIEAGQTQQAQTLLDKGLEALPNHQGLEELQDEL
jgi:serine/threonine protein kinase